MTNISTTLAIFFQEIIDRSLDTGTISERDFLILKNSKCKH